MTIKKIASKIKCAGGQAYFVGGTVRDELLCVPSSDIDIVVTGLSLGCLDRILLDFGAVKNTGREFLVSKIKIDSQEFDFSIARSEESTGNGFRAFNVKRGSLRDDLQRRDITINTIAKNVLTGELTDPFGGKSDIEQGIIRHTSPKFTESAERPLRLMQIAARYPQMIVRHDTIALCKTMVGMFDDIPSAQLKQQFEKLFLKGKLPSMGLFLLKGMGFLPCFPSLALLDGLRQDQIHHPEGDVFIHSVLTIDAMAMICTREGIGGARRLKLMAAALTHDMGKVTTTDTQPNGRITSYGHDKKTLLAEVFLRQVGFHRDMIRACVALIREHMSTQKNRIGRRAAMRIARRLSDATGESNLPHKSATIDDLCFLIEADKSGRDPNGANLIGQTNEIADLRRFSDICGVTHQKSDRILSGYDLIALGLTPGPVFRVILDASAGAQDNGVIFDKGTAISFAKQQIERKMLT